MHQTSSQRGQVSLAAVMVNKFWGKPVLATGFKDNIHVSSTNMTRNRIYANAWWASGSHPMCVCVCVSLWCAGAGNHHNHHTSFFPWLRQIFGKWNFYLSPLHHLLFFVRHTLLLLQTKKKKKEKKNRWYLRGNSACCLFCIVYLVLHIAHSMGMTDAAAMKAEMRLSISLWSVVDNENDMRKAFVT